MTKGRILWVALAACTAWAAGRIYLGQKEQPLRQLDELKARITGSTALPDPTNIASTGDWYYLDHVSSGLVAFDATAKKFAPMLAEKWSSRANGMHVFTLRPDAKFHDGTPVTVKDVIWSIKRQLIKKTATHFRFWEYIEGCANLKSLDEGCTGLVQLTDREIGFKLIDHADSFFLQLASPETGIFSAADMNPKDASLKATKFTGAYYIDHVEDAFALLKRNPFSPLSERFPESPKSIRLAKIPVAHMDDAVAKGEVDLVIRSYRPYGDREWQSLGLRTQETSNSNIIYLYGTGRTDRKPIGRNFVKSLWELNSDQKINPAMTFLPFSGKGSLTKNEFLDALPPETSKKLRVLAPTNFFADGFLDLLKRAAWQAGAEIEFHMVPGPEWNAAFDDPRAAEKYDYILSAYAASERYPTVQLRYLAGSQDEGPIDLKKAEFSESSVEQEKILRDYQLWLLHSKLVVPLFFNRTLFIFQKNIDIGDQSATDAEIELWRVKRKAP